MGYTVSALLIIVAVLLAAGCASGEPDNTPAPPTDAEMRLRFSETYQCIRDKGEFDDFISEMAEEFMELEGVTYSEGLDLAHDAAGDEEGFVQLMMLGWWAMSHSEKMDTYTDLRIALFVDGITGCYW